MSWRPPIPAKLACPRCKRPFQPRGVGHDPDCFIGEQYQIPEGIHQGYRLLVFGSRNAPPRAVAYMQGFLDDLLARHPDLSLLHGGAKGADSDAQAWADKQGVATEVWLPQYELIPRWFAPLWRNAEMAHRYPNAALGLIGPCAKEKCPMGSEHGSHGSVDMAARALDLGVPVFPHVWDGLGQLADWIKGRQ